jgi:hypothetical protein
MGNISELTQCRLTGSPPGTVLTFVFVLHLRSAGDARIGLCSDVSTFVRAGKEAWLEVRETAEQPVVRKNSPCGRRKSSLTKRRLDAAQREKQLKKRYWPQ